MFAWSLENRKEQLMMISNRSQGRIQDFWKGGGAILGLQAKKKGGGAGGGPTLGPMLKILRRGPEKNSVLHDSPIQTKLSL